MKFLKTLSLTLVVILMLGNILVFAEGSEYKEVLLDKQISFTFNGEVFVPREADGSVVYPITYNDRTYIPARFIAEKAGLDVTWDMTNQVVGFYKSYSVKPSSTETTPQIGTPQIVTALIDHDISFAFEDEKFVPTEADGTIVYPITYNDRTYIPARFIAEKAGLEVTWNEANKVVGFNTKAYSNKAKSDKTFLSNDIKYVSQGDFSYLTNGIAIYMSENNETDASIEAVKFCSLPAFSVIDPTCTVIQQEKSYVSFTNANEAIFFTKSPMYLKYYIKTENTTEFINRLLSEILKLEDGVVGDARITACNSEGDQGLLGTLNKGSYSMTVNAFEIEPGIVLFQMGDASIYIK